MPTRSRAHTAVHTKPHTTTLTKTGYVLLLLSIVLFIAVYAPILRNELAYDVSRFVHPTGTPAPMIPVDRSFGIMIPKIGANAHVIANVNPYDSVLYQRALTKGVAHAAGTGIPGQSGNIFLFAHSSVNFYDAARYNSIFYLINKLDKGDRIILYYHNSRYLYRVTGKHMVKPNAVEYLSQNRSPGQTVTLMTCWPPGTNFERLLVTAEHIQ